MKFSCFLAVGDRSGQCEKEESSQTSERESDSPGASGAVELDDGGDLQANIDRVSDRRATQYLVSGGGSADGKLALWRCAV